MLHTFRKEENMELYRRLKLFFETEPYAVESAAIIRTLLHKVGVWLFVCEVALIAQLYPTRWYADAYASNPSYESLIPLAAFICVIYIIGSLLHNRMDYWRNNFNHRISAMWWSAGHRKELELSTAWHVLHGTGEKEALIQKNLTRMGMTADYLLFEAIPTTVRVAFTSIAMAFISWRFVFVALGTFLLYIVVSIINYSSLRGMANEYHVRQKQLEEYGSSLTANWQTIRAFGQESYFSEKYKNLLLKFWEDENPRHRRWRRRMITHEHNISISRAILYSTIGISVVLDPQVYTVGTLALVVAWMERVYSNYYRMNDCIRHLHRGYESLNEVLNIFETPTDIPKPENPRWPQKVQGEIEFRNVSFAYPNATEDALTDINLTIQPNEVVAIIGPSGSGKSTLAKLLELAYHTTEGEILVDGVSLKQFDPEKYRREVIGVVTQQPQLFNESIADNIRIGNLLATDAEVHDAATAAYAHPFISEKQEGYQTLVGENGVVLSGGQKQRITIARALVRNPKILILDEATSALDCESQQMVQKAIDERIESKSCTTIIIAHRFSTIENADRVIALDKGRVAEIGTHAELSRRNGIYARFKQLETEGYLG